MNEQNASKKTYPKSKLAAKIVKKMFLYYSLVYIAVFVVIFSVLLPRIFDFSFQKSKETTSLIKKEFTDLQTAMQGGADYLYSSPQMSALLQTYLHSPTSDNAALIQLDLHSYMASQSAIVFLSVEAPDGAIFHTFNYSGNAVPDFLAQHPGYLSLKTTSASQYYSPVINDYFVAQNSSETFPVMFLSKKYQINSRTFIFTLFYDLRAAMRRNDILAGNTLDNYGVVDMSKNIIWEQQGTGFSEKIPMLQIQKNKTSSTIRQMDGIYFVERILPTSWFVISFASYGTLFANILLLIVFVLILYFIPPALFLVWVMPSSMRGLAPLKQLSDTMASFSIGKEVVSDIHTGDEIEELSNVYNMMIEKIHQQVKDLMEAEKRHSDTKYKLLATQIDPHFIYNTMNIINIMARQRKYAAIIEINTALTRILQERLGVKSSIFDTVEKEITTLKQYITIMNYRYQNSVKVHFDVEEALWKEQIPKNLLQPLIENSYYYGMLDEEGVMAGNIRILIYSSESKIIIEVSDDGNGIDPQKLEELARNNFDIRKDDRVHIGLENVQQRLKYIYDDQDCMEIRSTPNRGTTVILTLYPQKKTQLT